MTAAGSGACAWSASEPFQIAWPGVFLSPAGRCTKDAAIRDNYDRVEQDQQDVTRESPYSRYASPTTMLRSHTSADLPAVLDGYRRAGTVTDIDDLIAVPGLVHRRDVVDRTHVGAPHQVYLAIHDGPHQELA